MSLLAENHSQGSIAQAIRRSLKGSAFEVLMNLDTNVPIQEIIDKFDISFGTALSAEALLQEFYEARQNEFESITTWSCRVESMIRRLKERGSISTDGSDMARTKFFSGLQNDKIKLGIRHKFETNESYIGLLKAARALEQEHKEVLCVNVQTKQSIVSGYPMLVDKIDKVLTKCENIESRLDKVEKHVFTNVDVVPQTDVKICRYCKKVGHVIGECRKLKYKNEQSRSMGNEFVSAQRGYGQTLNQAPKLR
jgi:hypothetical protein